MVGDPTEVKIFVNGIETSALCDTGSCISTCSETFFKEYCQGVELEPVSNILKIECADGNVLPYKGCIEVNIKATGIPKAVEQPCLLLVVPDTEYNNSTPILLGTNILAEFLNTCKQDFGQSFLNTVGLHHQWFTTFGCMVRQERALRRSNNRIAILKSAEAQKVVIGPNQSVNITCVTDKEIGYPVTCAIIQESKASSLPSFVEVTPSLVHYECGKQEYTVNLSNVTSQRVVVAPKAIICEVQPATVDKLVLDQMETQSAVEILDRVNRASAISTKQEQDLNKLLSKHRHIFSKSDTDIGQCTVFKHRIELLDELPFKQRHRRIPPSMIEEVRCHLEDLLSAGVIRKSKSPWSSGVVLARKKSGKLRMCIDYRALNNRTKKDAYAIPRIEDIFDCLYGSSWFSTFDMKSGYYQIEVEESHKERTAFSLGPLGFYEFNKLPFGLCNSPGTYQRIMEECLGDYNMTICVIYLDDLVIFSDSYEEHLHRLDLIMTRLSQCGLKLNPEKCFLLQRKVKFLGHVISEKGIETDPDKVEVIKNYPRPQNSDELRSFLAFCSYYRKFVKDFARITKPLSDLLPPTSMRKKKLDVKQWQWNSEHEDTFQNLKFILTAPPVLAFPNFQEPFELHIDASTKGLGAVLYQTQHNQKRVIAYASRSLTKSEKNYSAFKLEFLALKWSITEKFSDYLIAKKFTVLTDNNPVTHVLTSAKLQATGQRWIAALSDYDFDILYRPGKKNVDADTLSRYPFQKSQSEEFEKIENSTMKAICQAIHSPPCIEVLPVASLNVLDVTEPSGQPMAQVEVRELRRQQRNDSIIGVWVRAVRDKSLPKKHIASNRNHQTMFRNFTKLKLVNGILYREIQENDEKIRQLVLPSVFRKQVFMGLHKDVGHPGKDRTASLVRERFYWPGYTTEVASWVEQCPRCLRRKSSTNTRAPLVSIQTSYPLELVSTDFLKVDTCKGGIENILVVTDHFTKYAIAVATKNQTAKVTAEALLNNFILHYGIPTRLLSDQGSNFESDIIRELCKLMNIEKSKTSIYNPRCNGISERYNRTLLNMLGTLEPHQKQDWKKYLPSLVYAYNATPHESTGFAPFELMFGRKPRLPIDSMFQLNINDERYINTDFVTELKKKIEITQNIASENLKKSRGDQKNQYDKKAKASKIEVGNKVLVKILAFKGRHKIADKFEEHSYTVVSQPNPELPVYMVRSPDGVIKTLHRNHLLPLDREEEGLEAAKEDIQVKKPVPRPRRSKVEPVKVKLEANNVVIQEEVESSDSELELGQLNKGIEELEVDNVSIVEQVDELQVDSEIEDDPQATELRRSARIKKPPDRLIVQQQQDLGKARLEKLLQIHSDNTRLTTQLLEAFLK